MTLKRVYEAPALMVETYMLDTSIAAGCGTKLNNRDDACYDEWAFKDPEPVMAASVGNSFSSSSASCDCYYTAGGQGFFTS